MNDQLEFPFKEDWRDILDDMLRRMREITGVNLILSPIDSCCEPTAVDALTSEEEEGEPEDA